MTVRTFLELNSDRMIYVLQAANLHNKNLGDILDEQGSVYQEFDTM